MTTSFSGFNVELKGAVTGLTAKASGDQTDATALTGRTNIIATCASTADSVILPAKQPRGTIIYVQNRGAESAKLFPNAGATIQGGTHTTTGITLATTTGAICVQAGTDGLTWLAVLTAAVSPG
jgi:hypothetical protein